MVNNRFYHKKKQLLSHFANKFIERKNGLLIHVNDCWVLKIVLGAKDFYEVCAITFTSLKALCAIFYTTK